MKTDAQIQKDVMDELRWEPLLNASEIGVSVKNGVTTLSGTVNSYYKKTTAEKAARRVNGVKAVAEDLEVRFSESLIKNDTEIAEIILNNLKWNSAIKEEKVKVKVDNGVVTLDGEVGWKYERDLIEAEVEGLNGVKLVVNNISIKPGILPKDLNQKIKSAFERNASCDADKIKVSVSGHTVTLSGKVRSWAEKNDAENVAWAASGVTKVENQLEIDSPVLAL